MTRDEKKETFFNRLNENVRYITENISSVVEYVCILMVLVAVIITIGHLIPELKTFFTPHFTTSHLMEYLEKVLTVVVGVEFIKMLGHFNIDNMLETIMLLVARHMVVIESTPLEDLIWVISIAILVLIKWFVKNEKRKHKEEVK